GTYYLGAVYTPGTGSNFITSNDTNHTLTVRKAPISSISTSASAIFHDNAQTGIQVSTHLTSAGGTVADGSVVFKITIGQNVIATSSASVSGGAAGSTFTLPAGTAPGSYPIETDYTGGTNFTDQTDSTGTLTVQRVYLVLAGFPTDTFAGTTHNLTVSVLDPSGQVVSDFAGTAALSSSDLSAGLPSSLALVNGLGTVAVTLNTPGLQSLTATDGTLTGTAAGLVVNHSPAWAMVDTAVGSDGNTRLLWVHPNGRAAVWTVDQSGNSSDIQVFGGPSAGPTFSGWRAIALAAGGDGLTRLLWVNDSGATALWLLNTDNTVLQVQNHDQIGVYGPIPGWRAEDVAVGSGAGSQTRILFDNLTGGNGTPGQVAVWTVSTSVLTQPAQTFAISHTVVFGPVPGWTARTLGVSPLDLPWILWNNGGTGQAALWQLNQDNTYQAGQVYTNAGSTALDVAVGRDQNPRLLWESNTSTGNVAVWAINSSGLAPIDSFRQSYGPYAGYTAVALEAGPDGRTRLIWTQADGSQALWLLNADDTFATGFYSGELTT
ncbi:MAG: hypothetical protein JO112_05255, partial [Planctomycetes bacterium]|nr:hypothetical protein [Planctomycetota bacterium]